MWCLKLHTHKSQFGKIAYSIFWDRSHVGWLQICYAAETGFELLVLLPWPPKCWDYRQAPLCLAYTGLGVRPTALPVPGKYHTDWVSPLSLPFWILPPRKMPHEVLLLQGWISKLCASGWLGPDQHSSALEVMLYPASPHQKGSPKSQKLFWHTQCYSSKRVPWLPVCPQQTAAEWWCASC